MRSFSTFALRSIIPQTCNQEYYAKALYSKKPIVIAVGPAGCGKTLLACQIGLREFKHKNYDKIVLTRPATAVDEAHGFLPGNLNQKMGPWLQPLYDSLEAGLRLKEIENMKDNKQLEIAPFAYMRGRTFTDSWIIADEMQNSTIKQMKMLLTRLGTNSKLVITGDIDQVDIYNNGMEHFLDLCDERSMLDHIEVVRLDNNDILRHDAVSEVLDIYKSENNK